MDGFIIFGVHYGEKPQQIKNWQTTQSEEIVESRDFEQPIYVEPSDKNDCPPGG